MFSRILVATLLCGSVSIAADEVVLVSGETLTGEWSVERVEIESASGEVIVPGHHLRSLERVDGGFVATLSDGSMVAGKPRLDAIELQTGLVLHRIELEHINAIRLETSPAELVASTLAAGSPIEVDRIGLDQGVMSTPCPLRLRLRLPRTFREGSWSTSQTRVVECDEVITISAVAVKFRRSRRGTGELIVWPHITVKPPQDKLADVSVTLTVAGGRVATARREIDAEEGRTTTRSSLAIELPADAVSDWSAGAEAFLDITLSAVDH